MKNNYININENEIYDITNHLSKTQYSLINSRDESTIKFQSLNKANLFDNGINKINKQMEIVYESLNTVNKIVKNKTNEILSLDIKLSSEAEEINVPTDFITNNSVKSHNYKQIFLDKNDGISINREKNTNESNLNFKDIINKKIIQNINLNDTNEENINLKNYTVNEKILKNIKNDNYISDIKLYDDIEIKEEYFYDDFFDN